MAVSNQFQVMLLTATQFHHKYKKTLILEESRTVLKATEVNLKSQEYICVLEYTTAQFTCFLYCSQITSQKSLSSMDRPKKINKNNESQLLKHLKTEVCIKMAVFWVAAQCRLV
jgi:hypothetical protein